MKLFRTGLLLVIGQFMLQLSFAVALLALHQQSQSDNQSIERSTHARDLLATAIFGHLKLRHALFMRAINDPQVERDFKNTIAAFDALAIELKEPAILVATVADARKNLLISEAKGREAQRLLHDRTSAKYAYRDIWPTLRLASHAISQDTITLNKIFFAEEALTIKAIETEGKARKLSMILLIVATILEMMSIAVTVIIFNRGVSSRMTILLENTERLSNELPLLPQLSGNDEISRLDELFRKVALAITSVAKNERDLVAKQRDVILEADDEFQIWHSNDACLAAFGLTAQQLAGRSIIDILHDDDVADVKLKLVSLSSNAEVQFEARINHDDGHVVHTLWSVGRSENSQSYFCVIHDNSKQKQSEQLRQEVLQMVGHDLRSPLTTVSGFLELFQRPVMGQLSPAGRKMIDSAAVDAQEMSTLINDLLNMEMIRAGMFHLQRRSLDLKELCLQAADSNYDDCIRIGCSVTIEETSAEIFADEVAILQVLNTLLHNAILRSPSDSTIVVTTASVPGYRVLHITDRGRVIAGQELPFLFEPFHRAEGGISCLSMAISKAFMELHGGSISVQSSTDKGTTFTLGFPNT